MTFGLMPIFDKSALNVDFLGAISIFLPPLRPFLPRGTGAESPEKSNIDALQYYIDIMNGNKHKFPTILWQFNLFLPQVMCLNHVTSLLLSTSITNGL